jgi:hypothetical protein
MSPRWGFANITYRYSTKMSPRWGYHPVQALLLEN